MAEPTEEEKRVADLNKELQKWEVLGIDPQHWVPKEGLLGMLVRFEILSEAMVEAGLLDMEEASAQTQIKSLKRLREIREELEPIIQQQKLDMIRNGRLGRK
jgi:hypothetical protein